MANAFWTDCNFNSQSSLQLITFASLRSCVRHSCRNLIASIPSMSGMFQDCSDIELSHLAEPT